MTTSTAELDKAQNPQARLAQAQRVLNVSVASWFAIAVGGQLIFIAAIVSTYYMSALQGDWQVWNEELTHGYLPGRTSSNLASLSHIFGAAIITLGGCLQLVPQIRSRFPRFHRWNGRVYVTLAFIMALTGLFLIWTTGTVGDWTLHMGTSTAGILIMLFAVQAWRYALARNFVSHRRWAIRLFLVVSTVWFFRVGLMLWFLVAQGPVGLDPETFTGPLVTTLAFAQWLIPLVVCELYFYAQGKANVVGKRAMAGGLFVLTLLTAAGVFMATIGMWFPGIVA